MVNEVKREGWRSLQENFLCDVFDVTFPVDVVRSATLERNGVTRFVAEVFLEQRSAKETRKGTKSSVNFYFLVSVEFVSILFYLEFRN